jgi:hypothetical protein
MAQLCPRCHRANPAQAAFCYHDGNMLRQGVDAVPAGQLSQEFVFPSGRRCQTYDDLVQGCYLEWEDARQLLHDGTFSGFLAGQGRADLARAAREGQALADRDIALTNFIAALPAAHVHGPKLGLEPRRLAVGPMRVGESRPIQVRILNEGKAMLQGKLTVADGSSWLKVVEGSDPSALAIRTPKEQSVGLRVDTAELVVGQHYAARLVVVTNGGVAEVPVRLDLVARPFASGPYQGVLTPRDLARRMRDAPQPAVALLEGGEVARWFAANGWAYPVAGGTAPGLASVQQFFEELGLAKAPPVSISEQEVRLKCVLPDIPSGQVVLRCATRKLVYGRAESDSPWLKATSSLVSGQMQAAIGFTVDPAQMPEDRTYQGNLRVVANAGQTFNVRVVVEVTGNRRGGFSGHKPAPAYEPVLASPQAAQASVTAAPDWLVPPVPQMPPHLEPPPSPIQQAPKVRLAPVPQVIDRQAQTPTASVSLAQAILVGAMLGLILRGLLVVPADLFARMLGTALRTPPPGTLQAWLQAPAADEGFLWLFVLATWWVGPLLGAWLVWRQGGKWTDLLCGLLAGSVAGFAGSATAGCLLVAGDGVPRLGLSMLLGDRTLSAAIATPLWIVVSVGWWLVVGAVAGLVLALGGRSTRGVLVLGASPVSGLARLCGLGKMADFFALRA